MFAGANSIPEDKVAQVHLCIPVVGAFNNMTSSVNSTAQEAEMTFNICTLPLLNLLGWTAIHKLDIDVCTLLRKPEDYTGSDEMHAILEDNTPHHKFHKAC
ncbi:hypothetical protein E2C01_051410 [Portunus trituberculatus]|uniref:Uncharacterized protein n=1 Tax=Portunus trituberculatus TaxID=210409 RepID=A0A5B7GBI6_PORTR|nr:hypothetical protein [Portunus trituberculatus]